MTGLRPHVCDALEWDKYFMNKHLIATGKEGSLGDTELISDCA